MTAGPSVLLIDALNIIRRIFETQGGSSVGELRVWDLLADKVDEVICTQPDHRLISSVAVSLDGRWVARGGISGGIALVETCSGQTVASVEDVGSSIEAMAFAPDGAELAVALGDSTALVWDYRALLRKQAAPLAAEAKGNVARLWMLLSDPEDARVANLAALELANCGNAVEHIRRQFQRFQKWD